MDNSQNDKNSSQAARESVSVWAKESEKERKKERKKEEGQEGEEEEGGGAFERRNSVFEVATNDLAQKHCLR